MSKFPLCEKTGLTIIRLNWPEFGDDWNYGIYVRDIERMLESAPIVFGSYVDCSSVSGSCLGKQWRLNQSEKFYPEHTHVARLLLIEPIQKETAESLLKELIAETDQWGRSPDKFESIKTRAKKLLGDK